MQEKIRGEEVEVRKLLIVYFISRLRKKISSEKQKFREIYKWFREFSLIIQHFKEK